MFIIKHKKIFLSISVGLVILSIISMVSFGFKVGIDFKGGALTEVYYTESTPLKEDLSIAVEKLGFGSILIQPSPITTIKNMDMSIQVFVIFCD